MDPKVAENEREGLDGSHRKCISEYSFRGCTPGPLTGIGKNFMLSYVPEL